MKIMQEIKDDISTLKGQVGEVKGQVGEVKGQVAKVEGQVAKVEGQVGEVQECQRALASKSGSAMNTERLHSVGKKQIQNLKRSHQLKRLKKRKGRAVLDQEQILKLNELQKQENFSEALLAQWFTPILQEMVQEASRQAGYKLVLVNCERHHWVQGADKHAARTHPDFFVTHPAFFKYLESSKDTKMGGKGFLFGKPSNWNLRDCIQICCELMLNDFPKHVAQVAGYSLLMSHNSGSGTVDEARIDETFFLLGDANNFSLINCFQGVPSQCTEGQWKDPGSRKMIIHYIMKKRLGNPWAQAMEQLCKQFCVTYTQPSKNSQCFLGCGSDGRVFRVQSKTGALYALKMALGDRGCLRIREEYRNHVNYSHVLNQSGSSVSMSKFYMDSKRQYVGLLVEPVGEPLERTEKQIMQALISLRSLTNLRLRHGDARLPNVIWDRDKNRALWLDLTRATMQGKQENPADVFAEETETFFNSFSTSFDVARLHASAISFFNGEDKALKSFLGGFLIQNRIELKPLPSDSSDTASWHSSFSDEVMEDYNGSVSAEKC
jgi:hypothetical protein